MIEVCADPFTELSVFVNWTGDSTVLLSFGDGPALVDVDTGGASVYHTYAQPGIYMVKAVDVDTGQTVESVQVYVRPGLVPDVTLALADSGRTVVEATFNDEPEDMLGNYEIDWDDDSGTQRVHVAHGDVMPYVYDRPGSYQVIVHDVDVNRSTVLEVTVPGWDTDPDFNVTVSGRTATVKLERVATEGQDIVVYWDDGASATIHGAETGQSVSHDYATDGDYIVQAGYADSATLRSAHDITITSVSQQTTEPRLIWSGDGSTASAVWLRWLDQDTDYMVQWGDGTMEWVGANHRPVRHEYAQPGVYTVTCILYNDWTMVAAAEVTIRKALGPKVNGSVRIDRIATIKIDYAGGDADAVCSPHRVYWGDGSKPENIDCGSGKATQQFPADTTKFNIQVEDVRARRSGMFSTDVMWHEAPTEWKLVDWSPNDRVYELEVSNDTDLLGVRWELEFTVPITVTIREAVFHGSDDGGYENIIHGKWKLFCKEQIPAGSSTTVSVAFTYQNENSGAIPHTTASTMWFSGEG